jgi:PAS domain S-box-containing protein
MARDLLAAPLLEAQPAADLMSNLLLTSTGAALVATGADGRVTLWNRGASEVYGYSTEEAVGRLTLADLFPTGMKSTATTQPPAPGSATQDAGDWSGLINSRRRSGETFPAEVSVTRMHGTGAGPSATGSILMVTAGGLDEHAALGALEGAQRYTHSRRFLTRSPSWMLVAK